VADHAHVFYRRLGNSGFPQIRLDKLNSAGFDMTADVFQLAAAKIVDYANLGSTLHQSIHQMRANQRDAAGHQHVSILPVHYFLLCRELIFQFFQIRLRVYTRSTNRSVAK
jgi:hypothetical protein